MTLAAQAHDDGLMAMDRQKRAQAAAHEAEGQAQANRRLGYALAAKAARMSSARRDRSAWTICSTVVRVVAS